MKPESQAAPENNTPAPEVQNDDGMPAGMPDDEKAFLKDGDPDFEAAPADPEPEPQADPEPQPENNQQKGDPTKALAESRFQQRQMQRQLKEMQDTLAQLRQPALERGDEPVIDPEKDPHGALRYMHAKLQSYENQEAKRQQEQAQEAEQQRVIGELTNYLQEGETAIRAEHPRYDDAAKHLIETRRQELAALGYADPNVQGEIIRNEYMQLTYQAAAQGQNPAYLIWAQAKSRGFNPEAEPEPQPAAEPEAQPNQQVQQQFTNMQKGQQQPKTGRGNPAKTSTKVTPEMLDNATGAEFDKLWKQYEQQNAS